MITELLKNYLKFRKEFKEYEDNNYQWNDPHADIKNPWLKLKKDFADHIEEMKMYCFYEKKSNPTKLECVKSFITGWLKNTVIGLSILSFICDKKGHDWIDDSYGGPESGCMAGHCERCGYSFHHTLY